ncbi:MAG: FAD-dependent oxidoreductase [Chloroflexi bacterium]|nr:FAD-dependent oxidoreductase [Chloroflexota bacterium]
MTTLPVRRLVAPCVRGCPAGLDIPKYIGFITQRNYPAALAAVRERMPLPDICGHVCYHPCETVCRRGRVEQPIAINALKRFCAQFDDGSWRARAYRLPPTGKKAAVAGSGPAGFACAYYLAKLGHSVTLFEATPFLGGTMRTGMPLYRLPRTILDKEMAQLGEVGVDIRLNTAVDSVEDLLRQDYQAVFLGLGAQEGSGLMVEGEDLPGVSDAVSFLRKVNLGERVQVGARVIVVGGGCVAVDGARASLRLGARDVTILYRRTRAEMPAHDFDVDAADLEGVKLEFLAAPVRIAAADGRLKVQAIRMKLGEPDATGRPRPVTIVGSEYWTEMDSLLAAIGQRPRVTPKLGVNLTRRGTIEADPATMAVSRQGVFSGGDAVLGPASFVEAIAHGRQAAISMDIELGGSGNIEEALAPEYKVAAEDVQNVPEGLRVPMPSIPLSRRRASFDEVETGYTEAQALEEANRCLKCDQWRLAQPTIWLARQGKGAG